ncbi:ABC transporter six-transmembrane domain-containing protein [Sphingomonas sp. SCN 67-18]|uniref:ABC transporter six-transmembrane domain-containing protein n=1 Tax=uncultured Sphingomonas sp. TaxID=158754 RepID=UPI000AFE3238|nr:ABC transporter six-transmembrane domain-containing protein [Sphingomonas sp. SCN 67-18]
MIVPLLREYRYPLAVAYGLSVAGYLAAQIYPLVTGLAINGVLQKNYSAILWLCLCHFIMVALEVSAKMMDTRVFTRIHTRFASDTVNEAHHRGTPPALIAGRATLLREYITFLERDIPAMLLSAISLGVAIVTLFWLDPVVGAACLMLLIPATAINGRLARQSQPLNAGLNDRLEREVGLLQAHSPARIRRHFRALAMWRVKLSDLEAKSYGLLELFVIGLFGVALWRVARIDGIEAGTIYAIFAYIWRFVTSMDQVPQIVQQIAKLADINRRLKS